MKTCTLKCYLVSLFVLLTTLASAQTKLFEDAFETGTLASGWTQSSGSTQWSVGTSNLQGITAHEGTYYASLYSNTSQSRVMLITPLTDVSSLTSPVVSFYAIQQAYGNGNHDTLRVYARSTSTGAWVEQEVLTNAEPMWTKIQVPLTGFSNSVQIAFEYCYGAGRGIGLDDVYIGTEAPCQTPDGLQAIRVFDTSATLIWTGDNNSLQYNLKVSTTPMTDLTQTANVYDGVVYDRIYPITGLTASTTYYFYVKADCGNSDVSGWSQQGSFTTACSAAAVPYTENFNNYSFGTGTFPTCWSKTLTMSGDWSSLVLDLSFTPYLNAITKRGSGASLCLSAFYQFQSDTYISPNLTTASAATPALNVTDITDYQVSLWVNTANINSQLQIGVMTDPTDASTFEEAGIFVPQTANSWEEVIVTFNNITNDGKYVGFIVSGTDATESQVLYIDDVTIDVIPPCGKPSALRCATIGTDSTTLTWSSAATLWNLKVSTTQLTDPSTGVANVFSGVANSNPFTITGLQPETRYYFYVQADCSADGSSVWSNEGTFKTGCGKLSAFPYYEDFTNPDYGTEVDGMNTAYPTCWTRINEFSDYTEYPLLITDYAHPDRGLTMDLRSYSVYNYSVAILPEINLDSVNPLRISFDAYFADNNSGINVGVMTDPTDFSTFVPVKLLTPYTGNPGNIMRVHADFKNYTGTGKYIALATNYSQGGQMNQVMIDNLEINYSPSCQTPVATIDSITDSRAVINWSTIASETSYNVKVSNTWLADPTTSTANIYDGTLSGNTLTVTGLNEATLYFVYTQSICAAETGDWEWTSFTTECSQISALPWSENFDSYEPGSWYKISLPPCWTETSSGWSINNLSTSTAMSGNALTFDWTSNMENTMSMPYCNLPLQGLELNFYCYPETSNTILYVGVMSDRNDLTTFVPVDTIADLSPNAWHLVSVPFASYTGTGKYIAFRTFEVSGYNSHINIDEVSLREHRNCAIPTNLTVTRVDTTSARMMWSSDNGSSFNIKISSQEINPEVDTADIATLTEIPDSYYTITGLSVNTKYYFYVQGDCGSDGVSYWSEVGSFKTNCVPETTIPYSENFDSYSQGEYPSCWQEIVETIGMYSVPYSYYPYCSGQSLRMMGYYNVIDDDNVAVSKSYAIMQGLNVNLQALQITFEASSSIDNGKMYIGVMTDVSDASTFDLIDSIRLSTNLEERIVQLNNYQGTGKFIAFMVDGDAMQSTYYAYLDNVVVDSITTCNAPSEPTATNITSNSASLSWRTMSNDSQWQLQVSTELVYDMLDVDTISSFVVDTLVTSLPVDITGLNAQTTYYFYIRTRCADGSYSARAQSAGSFRTGCSTYTVPFVENFDDDVYSGMGSLPECWTGASLYDEGRAPSLWMYDYYSGSQSMYFSSMGNSYTYAALPPLDAAISTLSLSFMSMVEDVSSTIQVGVMTDPTDFSTFVQVAELFNTAMYTWQEQSVSFNTYTGVGQYIAFRSYSTVTSNYNTFFLDDISIEVAPTCLKPKNDFAAGNITATSATFTWTNGGDETSWDLVVGAPGFDPDVATAIAITTNPYTMSGLTSATVYEAYIRSNCGAEDGNSTWRGPIRFVTKQVPVALPFTCNFENASENAGWVTANAQQSNQWTIGSAVANGGTNSLYVSNDHGTTNNYSATTSSSWATRMLTLPAGVTDISFDWLCTGVSMWGYAYDFMCAYLVPESVQLNDGEHNNIYDPSTVPSGWIKLMEGVGQTTWTNFSTTANIATAGNYQLVFYWRNSFEESGVGAAVDNINVSVATCYNPFNLKVSASGDTTTSVTWTSDAASWNVKVSTTAIAADELDTITADIYNANVTVNEADITGLTASTDYYYYIQGICSGDSTEWVEATFTTLCAAVEVSANSLFSDNFEGLGYGGTVHPTCWTTYMSYSIEETWGSEYPFISNNWDDHGASLYFQCDETNYTYAATPALKGLPMNELQVVFESYKSYNNSYILVGIMTDPYDISTFEKMDSIVPTSYYTWEVSSVNFSNYSGNGRYIAFYCPASRYYDYRIDNVSVELAPECVVPTALSATNITTSSADINWATAVNDTVWQVKVFSPSVTASMNAQGDIYDGTTTTKPLSLTGLTPATVYTYMVKSPCSPNNVNSWKTGTFTTSCDVLDLPFDESMSSATFPPACWNRYNAIASQVFLGGVMSDYTDIRGWMTTSNNYGINGTHAKNVVYGVSSDWLITPEINVTGNSLLSFDLALTGNAVADAVAPGTQSDDKFMIIVSTDGGTTWNAANTTIWSNDGQGDYVYDQIPNTAQRQHIVLNQYAGHNVRIAFYSESLSSGTVVNDIHLANVHINAMDSVDIADQICEGYAYAANGFDIAAADLNITESPFTFTRIGESTSGNDSLITLTLNVVPSAQGSINASICQGETYIEHGFNESEAGSYNLTLLASDGCDSIVTLNLTIIPTYNLTDNLELTESDLPYSWNDQTITAAGEYTYNGQSVDGCDSTVVLTVTLATGIDNVTSGRFDITPNPVAAGGKVLINAEFNEADRTGLKVEIFNAAGSVVKTVEPTIYPLWVTMPYQSGLYMVRITTGTGKVMYGKVVVN